MWRLDPLYGTKGDRDWAFDMENIAGDKEMEDFEKKIFQFEK